MKSRTIAVALMVSLLFVLASSGQARADKIKPMAEAVFYELQNCRPGTILRFILELGPQPLISTSPFGTFSI